MPEPVLGQLLKRGQKVRLTNGTILTFSYANDSSYAYPLVFLDDNNKTVCLTKFGCYQSHRTGRSSYIAEVFPVSEPTKIVVKPTNDTPEPVTETTTTVDAVPAPTTMQELYEAALADLSVSDQEIVKAHIKNRLIEVQRLQTLLSKAQRELDHFMQLPVEEAVLRLTHQDRRTGMQFRAIAAPKDTEELRYGL